MLLSVANAREEGRVMEWGLSVTWYFLFIQWLQALMLMPSTLSALQELWNVWPYVNFLTSVILQQTATFVVCHFALSKLSIHIPWAPNLTHTFLVSLQFIHRLTCFFLLLFLATKHTLSGRLNCSAVTSVVFSITLFAYSNANNYNVLVCNSVDHEAIAPYNTSPSRVITLNVWSIVT